MDLAEFRRFVAALVHTMQVGLYQLCNNLLFVVLGIILNDAGMTCHPFDVSPITVERTLIFCFRQIIRFRVRCIERPS